ncbi:MAG TPA: tryptophan 2,3-dioxygenase family protein [Candidatus Polarisedimenticolaceae bacterium]|nr:tryptophan 2,3-dioxygenase family protein [Candidatus Polarisedimenticolaceae bacterium]
MPDLTYASYLHLDRMLELQEPRSVPPEHDEMLFIVIHQVFELWFKEVLHEIEKIKADFTGNDLFGAIHTFKRVRTIFKTLVGQLDILETMTPMSFSAFRDRLDTASGFQSYQFRELEFVLGYKRPEMLAHAAGPTAAAAMSRRLRERSLVDHFYDFLEHQGVTIPAELRAKPVEDAALPHPEIQAALLALYKTRPELGILFESMTDLDEGFQEWKYRHVKLVERTIGNKRGTGGSLGVEFLKRGLFKPVFPDLWAIRHEL